MQHQITAVISVATAFACSSSLAIAAAFASPHAPADNRDVQIRTVDFLAETIELHNFGCADIALDGWRFCSHDFDQVRIYSSPSGLNGVTIAAGTSLTVHLNNDAPVGDPDHINRSVVGSFATPLSADAYGMQIFNVNAGGFVAFGDSTLIADHLQWNRTGGPIGNAGFRSGQAVTTGLWTAATDFVISTPTTGRIELNDLGNGRLHGPADYDVINCAADLGFAGPGAATLSMCGGFASGESSELALVSTPPSAPAALLFGLQSNPVPIFGGMLVPVPDLFSFSLTTDSNGEASISVPGGGGPATFFLQAVYLDLNQAFLLGFTNAIQLDVEP